jgi:solute carrier family 6 amino acid/orphan transporter-like 15/16/17/18/20
MELGGNGTMVPVPECEKSSETAYFWYRQALDITPTIDETGGIKWWMLICLLLAWIVIYFIIMRGIQSSGKVSDQSAEYRHDPIPTLFESINAKGHGPRSMRKCTSI